MPELVVFGLPLLVLLILYIWYVAIISRRNAVLDALSGIDVHLKKRHDLIPNVLAIAKRFMLHEQQLLEDITRIRTEAFGALQKTKQSQSAADVSEHFALEQQLQTVMSRLMVQAEAYPDLTSAEPMLNAQHTYQEVETNIAAARRFYNTSVRRLRNITEIFPGSALAAIMSVDKYPFFQTDSVTLQPVDAHSTLSSK